VSHTRQYRVSDARYRLIRPIAEGQTATVWHARDTVSETDVVIKRLDPAAAHDPVARRRLEEEAAIAARLSHPNSVPLLDAVFNEEEASLVFPYIAGDTLADRIRDKGALESRSAAAIAVDVADVLSAAHEADIVHRDVKAGNILVDPDGRAHLVDFGIARNLDAEQESRRSLEMTGSGMAVGTLPYMAPEQLTGGAPSATADVYALGVVLYEMLAGSRPYEGTSPAGQLELQQQPPATIEGADPALVAMALAALDPLPDRRPTAAQFGRSLRAWLDGRETEAATSTVAVVNGNVPPSTYAALASNPRRLVPAAAVFGVALLIGAVTLAFLGSALTNEPAPEATAPAAADAPTQTPPPTTPKPNPPKPADVNTAQQPTRSSPNPPPSDNGPKKEGHKNKHHKHKKHKKPKHRH
jgi:serine/threonine protein kinase